MSRTWKLPINKTNFYFVRTFSGIAPFTKHPACIKIFNNFNELPPHHTDQALYIKKGWPGKMVIVGNNKEKAFDFSDIL